MTDDVEVEVLTVSVERAEQDDAVEIGLLLVAIIDEEIADGFTDFEGALAGLCVALSILAQRRGAPAGGRMR